MPRADMPHWPTLLTARKEAAPRKLTQISRCVAPRRNRLLFPRAAPTGAGWRHCTPTPRGHHVHPLARRAGLFTGTAALLLATQPTVASAAAVEWLVGPLTLAASVALPLAVIFLHSLA